MKQLVRDHFEEFVNRQDASVNNMLVEEVELIPSALLIG
jgi:hypothetical protein